MLRLTLFVIAVLAATPARAGDAQAAPAPGPVWLGVEEGLARAKSLDFPVLVWLASRGCASCGAEGFANPDVREMLPDFVMVRADLTRARGWDLPERGPVVALLDSEGNPLPDLHVEAGPDGRLAPEEIIDLLSSGLDVLR